MVPALVVAIPLAVLVIAELGRTLVSAAFVTRPERYAIKLMKLPGSSGSQGLRLALILAGPITAYLAIAGLAFGYFGCYGTDGSTNVVRSTSANSPASTKVADGDVIVAVDGVPFTGGARELAPLVTAKQGAPITLAIERGGKRAFVTLEPKHVDRRWLLGISFEQRRTSTGDAFKGAIAYPASQSATIAKGLVEAVKGKPEADLGGPIRIVSEFQTAFEGAPPILPLSMVFGTYALLALALLDFIRLVALLLFRS